MIGGMKETIAAGGAATGIIAFLTIPAIIDHVARWREKKEKASLYEDDDGVATEESMAKYSTTVAKILLAIFTTLGLLTAIALGVLALVYHDEASFKIENWLNAASWVCGDGLDFWRANC